ncbi:hypothetical protein DXA57_13690 [Blautia sp. OF03-15BH]|uniref:GDSL-type esterase/lipase family protein n=1 Tax=Blautia sp. OF03-15BH TaxID=2292287 RepID=UPI000E4D86C4|nr:GDSL-type esterase/lipase family protein [Blautia sp. OF03-15BH]RGX99061.1 hypothetical protein DXA57_13690 [Blautia sp. OF03-15BH]
MSEQKKKKRRNPTGRFLHVLILVVAVLVIFEGRMVVNIITRHGVAEQISQQLDELFAGIKAEPSETEKSTEPKTDVVKNAAKDTVAGLTLDSGNTTDTKASSSSASSSASGYVETGIDHTNKQVVQKQATAIDDTYFADATFVGDSRLEGFRNQSGITTGDFLTSVGMNVCDIFTKQSIASPDGNITVFQAMYPEKCKKIYFMLGTNELGNVWEDFTKGYRLMMSETRRLFPDAIIYAIAVPYVEEAKVTTGDYINNANVDKMNNIILNICNEGGYYFLDVNEVLSDGNHALINGASSDGVHMYEEYCKKMLDYLKTHYVSETSASSADTSSENSSETESETSSETETTVSN